MARSTAIVVFTDLVGSTELRSRLGEDAAEDLRRNHDRLIATAVEAHRGRLVKNLGDGVMVTFTGASDALGAVLAIQQAFDRQNRSGSVDAPLEVRIGLSAGDVAFEEGDCFGTPVIEAARLCAAAGGGQILATDVVRVLAGTAGGYQLRPVGELDLKGLPAPVAACEVTWEPLPGALLPMPTFLTRTGRVFVGREDELERLLRLWKEAIAGERRVALVAGEPGIGKTRLAVEVAGAARESGGVVLAGRCDEDLGVPYQPFVEALRHYVTAAQDRRLGRYAGELARLLPDLTGFVGELPEPLRSDPETERYRLFDALAAWLADVSAEAPVLLVLDDLHWAAKPTLLLLRHVLRSPEALRVLVVITYRDSDIGRGHPMSDLLAELRRDGGAERMTLFGLDVPAVAAFIESAAGHRLDDEEAEELPRVVWRETEGNPFFVAEVLRHLSESGAIGQRDGRWVLNASVEELGIPEGVRDVVGRRLSRLSEPTNRLLAAAAVIGPEFEPAVVERAAGGGEDEVLTALEEATQARLLVEVPGPRYRFAHALVRATLYDELSGARRVALHRRVAEAIESLYGAALDDHLPALAYHWARASAPAAHTERAVDYATRAGDRALAQFAHDEAAAYYVQALELLDTAGVAADDGRRLELLIRLGEAQRRGGNRAHRETLLAAAHLAQTLGDGDALARAALANSRAYLFTAWNLVDVDKIAALEAALEAVGSADSPVRARLLATLGLELVFDKRALERRRALNDDALAIARRLGDGATIVPVLIARYGTTMPNAVAGRLADSAELAEAAQSVSDPVLRSHAWGTRFRTLFEAGDVEEANRCLARAAELIEDLGQPGLLWSLTYYRAAHAIMGARFDEAESLTRRTQELGTATGQEGIGVAAMHRFLLRFAQGTLDSGGAEALSSCPPEHRLPIFDIFQILLDCELGREAEARGRLARVSTQTLPHDLFWLGGICALTTVAAALGEVPLAEELHALLLPYADHAVPMGVVPLPAVVHHLGLTAMTIGSYDEADEWFQAAAAIHERMASPAWLARTRLEWARMLLTRHHPGDAERARELLGQALNAARELGLANIERRAVHLLT